MASSDTALLIQARYNSTRLPGKVLKTLGGHAPMLGIIHERLREVELPIVVATSAQPTDDPIAAFCEEAHIPYFRGDLDDVLGRFDTWLRAHPDVERCVRLTGDNPLVDAPLIDRALRVFDDRDASRVHAVSNHLPDHRTDPYGYAAEVVSARALRALASRATALDLREHVTLSFVRDAQVSPFALYAHTQALRWTVDTPEDFDYVDRLFKECGVRVSAQDAIAWSMSHEHA